QLSPADPGRSPSAGLRRTWLSSHRARTSRRRASSTAGSTASDRADQRQQLLALAGRLYADPLEVASHPNIRVQAPRDILMEVKERLGATIEDASLPLDEPRHAAKLTQQRLEVIECIRPGVSHETTVRLRPMRFRRAAPRRSTAQPGRTSACRRPSIAG